MALKHLLIAAATVFTSMAAPGSDPRPRTSYLTKMAKSYVSYGVPGTFHYSEAVLAEGFEAAIALTGDESLVSWYRNQIDGKVVLEDGTIRKWNLTHYSLDDYRIANNFLWWYKRTGEDKYRVAAETIREQINRHPRTPTGGFWHRKPAYPNQMWLDGIFMVDSFYATWTNYFDNDNTTAWDDILLQYDNIEKATRNKTSNLLVHGYDESKVAVWADPITGAAPLVWSRAVGWYYISLIEVLQLFPKAHAGYGKLVNYYKTLSDGLLRAQDKTGGWWLIMNEGYPGRKGNYIESSASAMFTYGMLKGIDLGLIDRRTYLKPAKKAYGLLTDRFVSTNQNGTINWEGTIAVGSLSSNGSYEYYIGVPIVKNDYKGTGPFMLASYEYERWASRA